MANGIAGQRCGESAIRCNWLRAGSCTTLHRSASGSQSANAAVVSGLCTLHSDTEPRPAGPSLA